MVWLVGVVIISVLAGLTRFMWRGCGYGWWLVFVGLGGVSKRWVGMCRWYGLGIDVLLGLPYLPYRVHLPVTILWQAITGVRHRSSYFFHT